MDRVTPITISTVCIHLRVRARWTPVLRHIRRPAVLLLNGLNTRGKVTCLYRVTVGACYALRRGWQYGESGEALGGLAAVVFHGTTDDPSACRGCPGKQLLCVGMGPGCSTGCPGLAGCA